MKGIIIGNDAFHGYYINSSGEIDYKHYSLFDDVTVFTLEEFLEKFPYKVGDKVRDSVINDCVGEIISAQWGNNENQIIYVVEWDEVPIRTLPYYAIDLQPYKEETMKEKLEQITLDIPKGYEFFGINDDNQVVLAKKQLQYPTNYEECCEILGYEPNRQSVTGYLAELIEKFQQLIICRYAYWKIGGEPDMQNNECYCLYYSITDEAILKQEGYLDANAVLTFPTKEIRNAFYENFKDLIEICKELL